ncbi:MAG: FAD-dependent oxidoreductase [Solirubrobacteraceae bacterium]
MTRLHQLHDRPRILIAGGGVAALEAMMALRAMVGSLVHVELVAPEVEFSYRPVAVAAPFGMGEVRRFELAKIAADHDAHHRQDSVAEVDRRASVAVTESGERLVYDYLVLATGAHRNAAIEGALTFGGEPDRQIIEGLLQEVQKGTVRRLVFAAPPDCTWPLPLYELGLFTAAWAQKQKLIGLELSIVTPENVPLEAFGSAAGEAVAELLAASNIALHAQCVGVAFDGDRLSVRNGTAIAADAVIALPRLSGRQIRGVPHDREGFIPTNRHGGVRGIRHVYAAGDGTTFPIKQGGLAAQQADAVAEAIAADVGALQRAQPFRPVLRGLLLTGAEPRYLRAKQDPDVSEIAFTPLWWPPSKIAGRYLAPYLARSTDPALAREPFADRGAPVEPESLAEVSADEREAVEVLLELAEANARRESFDFALKCLDAAEDVGGPLPAPWPRERRAWEQRR